MKSKKGHHTSRKHRVKDDVDDQNKKELDAIAADEKAKAAAIAYQKRWNQFDGSFHNDDGSQILPDGSHVRGVNKFVATNSHEEEDDDVDD